MNIEQTSLIKEELPGEIITEVELKVIENDYPNDIQIAEDLKMTVLDFIKTFTEPKDIIEAKGRLIDFIRNL